MESFWRINYSEFLASFDKFLARFLRGFDECLVSSWRVLASSDLCEFLRVLVDLEVLANFGKVLASFWRDFGGLLRVFLQVLPALAIFWQVFRVLASLLQVSTSLGSF